MPHIAIQMYPGRDKVTKAKIAKRMQTALAEEMGADKKYFSVSIEDVASEDWKTTVEDKIDPDKLFISSNF
ncbi:MULTISPECIES: tautomerase family protein [unclassified Enterococcus]|uniref:tautomerase family protein n=1 Tax=unclassified Enterococcus TaxID=2608891 RepID=UPI000A335BB1|nr:MULTISPECIES: tautomerase family protein [unclassified Enterococcus]OTO67570.1 hypothetical protein A5865_003249 [Enterococcus sp. 12E11_DIV0728]OUZ15507.1 hypothetical protein A5868_000418 [Enterococcus sp. 12F9_DIV0723]